MAFGGVFIGTFLQLGFWFFFEVLILESTTIGEYFLVEFLFVSTSPIVVLSPHFFLSLPSFLLPHLPQLKLPCTPFRAYHQVSSIK